MSSCWLEKDLFNQKTLNSVKKNTNPSLFNCCLYKEADQYYITDSESKIKVTLNPKCINRLKKLKTEHKFIKIYLKQYFYSSNINFKSSGRERYLFMFIEDFESNGVSIPHIDIAKLNILNHPSLSNRRQSSLISQQPQSSLSMTPQPSTKKPTAQSNNLKNDSTNGNLSALINNLTQDGSFQDYTIDIIEDKKDPKNENKKISTTTPKTAIITRSSKLTNNLNEGFFKDSLSQSSSANKENSKDLIMDDVIFDLKSHPVKLSTQLVDHPNSTLDFSAINSNYCTSSTQNNVDVNIKTTKSCIKITLINESTVDETNSDENNKIEANFKTPVKIKNEFVSVGEDDKSNAYQDYSSSIIEADNEDTNTSDNKSINPQIKILDTQQRKPPLPPQSAHLSHPSTPSINSFKNHLTPFNRRESVQSNISDASLDASFDHFLNNTSSSPNKFKRKRKLINNQVADDILQQKDDQSDEKTNENKNLIGSMNSSASTSSRSNRSRSSSSSSSVSSYMSLDSSITEVCSKSLIFAPKSYYMYKEKLFKKSCSERKPPPTSKYARPNSNNPISQIFSPRSTSKSSTHVKSLFKNNNPKHASSLTNISSASNQKDPNSIEQQKQLQNNSNIASNVLDKLINIEDTTRLKKNVNLFNPFSSPSSSTSPNNKDNNQNNSLRKKRLFNPSTFNVDTAFDLPMQPILIDQNVNNNITENENTTMSSETATTKTNDSSNIITSDNTSNQTNDSNNDTNKDSVKTFHSLTNSSSASINGSNQDTNKSDKSIPSGQNPNNQVDENLDKKLLNDNFNNTSNKSINLITSPNFSNVSDSINDSNQLGVNIMNYNFQLNPDSLQSYLIESKNLVECLEVIN